MILKNDYGQTQNLIVGDLTRGDVPQVDHADIVYSVPPWNPGTEKWWRRDAKAPPSESYEVLLDSWCQCVASINPCHVLCEQSCNDKHRAMYDNAVSRCSDWKLPLYETWTVFYGSPGSCSCTRPNTLLHYGHKPLTTNPSGMSGEAMVLRAFEGLYLLPEMIVCDPCMGKGMASRMAHFLGCSCAGMEINKHRLDYAIKWLMKRGYKIAT